MIRFDISLSRRQKTAYSDFCPSLLTRVIVTFGFTAKLGAFLAGALLAETNFRTQIEADIRPFRGLLLGLFFVTTGTSIDTQVLLHIISNIAF